MAHSFNNPNLAYDRGVNDAIYTNPQIKQAAEKAALYGYPGAEQYARTKVQQDAVRANNGLADFFGNLLGDKKWVNDNYRINYNPLIQGIPNDLLYYQTPTTNEQLLLQLLNGRSLA